VTQDWRAWFHVAEVEPGVTLVGEPGYVYSWLVDGGDDQLLLDTGMGVADIRAAVARLARDPLVVNSHAHFDHIGGNALFSRRMIHPLGVDRLAATANGDGSWAYSRLDLGSEATRGFASRVHESWRAMLRLDREFLFVLGPEEEVRQWPSVPPGTFPPAAPPPTGVVGEGHVFDLGSRRLRLLHTPGHAAEHVCLVDEQAGILFAQDQAYYGPHLVCLDGSNLEDWVMSARRLAADLYGSIRIVYTAHSLRWSAPPKLLRELADAGERVLSGETPLNPISGPDGQPALAADFGHFTIIVAAGDAHRPRGVVKEPPAPPTSTST
jgi:glyoxylase-like metal-dependent hydrolase (beta-lactamase superfamily II)